MTAITIQVPDQIAQAYAASPPEQRQKYDLLLQLRLGELVARPLRPLSEILDEVGQQAEQLGLTDEELQGMLHDR